MRGVRRSSSITGPPFSAVLGGVSHDLVEKLLDPLEPGEERDRGRLAVESWRIRRRLLETESGNDDTFRKLHGRVSEVENPYQILIAELERRGWPDNCIVQSELPSRPIYPYPPPQKRKPLVRLVLEAIEWHLGGNPHSTDLEIEHIMPRKWQSAPEDWRLGSETEEARDVAIATLGNLTLLTCEQNRKLSNHSWVRKVKCLREYDKNGNLSPLTKRLLDDYGKCQWNEDSIRQRGRKLAGYICTIWPRATEC